MIDGKSPTETVGRRIKIRRAELGLSQSDVARPDLSDSYISLIESGRRTPSDDVLSILATRLGCTSAWLRSGVDEAEQRSIHLQLKEAELCLRTGDPDRALNLTSDIIESVAADESARDNSRFLTALALESLGRLDKAVDTLEALAAQLRKASRPVDVRIVVALSRCLRESGDLGAAIDSARRALETLEADGAPIDDQYIELSATLLAAYNERGDFGAAQRIAESTVAAALRWAPGSNR